MSGLWSSRSLILQFKPYSWERLSQRATKKHAIYSQTPSLLLKKNGDKMTDEKTTKELMKALIEYLRAKTEESEIDKEFTKRILLDEVEVTFTEEQSWPEEFEERWG